MFVARICPFQTLPLLPPKNSSFENGNLFAVPQNNLGQFPSAPTWIAILFRCLKRDSHRIEFMSYRPPGTAAMKSSATTGREYNLLSVCSQWSLNWIWYQKPHVLTIWLFPIIPSSFRVWRLQRLTLNDLPRLMKRTFFGRILQHGQVETVIWTGERCSGVAWPVKVKRRKKTGWRAGNRRIRQYRDVSWKPNKPAVVVVQFSGMMRY